MPLQSKEVVTVHLLVDCQLAQDDRTSTAQTNSTAAPPPTGFLKLPVEVRLKILRHLLLFDLNSKTHTRRLPANSINHLLSLDSRRILEAPQFKHKGKQEINGVLPTYTICHIHPSILRVCWTLYWEGCSILYGANMVAAVQSGISGLGSRLRNYGVRVWGPLESSRIPRAESSSAIIKQSAQRTAFRPLITFRGQSSKPESPVYICGQRDITHLIHALWILIKCPFARGMKFTVHVAPTGRLRLRNTMDGVVRFGMLPWMHNHIEKITGSTHTKESLGVWNKCLETHRAASIAEPNVYTYNVVCAYLEQLMASAEKAVEARAYTRAETLHELVCYEACSIVRTRTGKLVDVSTKTKEGINRVCKLIAISAFRLCEIRSGAIALFSAFRPCICVKSFMNKKKGKVEDVENASMPDPCPLHSPGIVKSCSTSTKPVKTTRLDKEEAVDHAILSALLALRLPCATPVPEWNVRLNQMLLYLFNLKNDRENAKSCIRRLHQTCSALSKDAGAKNKTGGKWTDLEILVADLKENIDNDVKGGKKRSAVYHRLVEETQDVVRKLWGERLTPKKGYIGLIWTFRWA